MGPVNLGNPSEFTINELSNLIKNLTKINGLKRIRFITSHPLDMEKKGLIAIHKNESKLMPYLHLPVQSGSDKILKNMNRNHTIEEYLQIIEKLKNKNSSIKFSSDFIIAYPDETKDDFEK